MIQDQVIVYQTKSILGYFENEQKKKKTKINIIKDYLKSICFNLLFHIYVCLQIIISLFLIRFFIVSFTLKTD